MPQLAKTERWAKCAAVAVLVGVGTGILSIIVSFIPFYDHYARLYPADNQNLLSALTASVLAGLGLGGFALVATVAVYLLPGLRGPRPE